MRAQVILSLAVVFTFWFVEAAGQTRQGATSHDAIELGATKLSIGMPQDSVIAKLAEEYKVEKEGGGWLIEQKEGPPFPPVANIAFENGKLQEVRKYWGPEDQAKGVEFATTLYGLIASFSEEGRRNCIISVGETYGPDYNNKSAFISCGQKRIEISIAAESSKLPSGVTNIDEVMGHAEASNPR